MDDPGYTDYDWFGTLTPAGAFFVTRQKKNASDKVLERHKCNQSQGLISDQTIWLTGLKATTCPYPLRRIGYRDPETKKHYVFLTNNFKLSAKTIADIYKERWQSETFFRWIKQNLKIKAFVGNSENAVMTQIYVALIAYLLLCYFKFLSCLNISLQNLLRLLQPNLFRTCTLQDILEPPSAIINNRCNIKQLTIALA